MTTKDNIVSKVRNAPEKYKHIITAMEQEYIENGYLNCASMLVPTQFGKLCGGGWDETQRAIQELAGHGIIELRKCADYAVQLTVRKRYELIQKYDLARVWEQKAPYFYPNGEYGEVTCVLRDFELSYKIDIHTETIAELEAIKAKMDTCSYCGGVIENEADMRFDTQDEDKFYHKDCLSASLEGGL